MGVVERDRTRQDRVGWDGTVVGRDPSPMPLGILCESAPGRNAGSVALPACCRDRCSAGGAVVVRMHACLTIGCCGLERLKHTCYPKRRFRSDSYRGSANLASSPGGEIRTQEQVREYGIALKLICIYMTWF